MSVETLLNLPVLAQSLGRRVVLILQSFPHPFLGSQWGLGNIFTARDQASDKWRVLVAIAETSTHPEETSNSLEIVQLFPLADDIVAAWVQEVPQGLT